MVNIIKVQLQLKNPKKTISILLFCIICFAALAIYMVTVPTSISISNNILLLLSNKLSLSYLSMLAITGSMVFLSFNGFIEDKSIFMSLLASKVNIFKFILSKVIASAVYSLLSIPLAFLINQLYIGISIIDLSLVIISELLMFYMMYFVVYLLLDENKFDIFMAYTIVLISVISTLIPPILLFVVIVSIFLIVSLYMYKNTNAYISKSLFNTKYSKIELIKNTVGNTINRLIDSIVFGLSKITKDYKFLAILTKDLHSLFSFVIKLILLHVSLLFVSSDYKLICTIIYQIIIVSFLKDIYYSDVRLLSLKLISYKEYFKIKFIIISIFNLIIQVSFIYYFGNELYNIIGSTLIIIIVTLFDLTYRHFQRRTV